MLQLTTWPKSVPVLGVEFPVCWADLGDDHGEMKYEPEPGGETHVKVHQRFSGTDYAWLVLFHELTHAALAVSGATALLRKGQAEEAVVLATEAVWSALVAVGKRASSVRGSKGRATKSRRTNPRTRRPSR